SICLLQVEVPGRNQMLSTSTCREFAWSLQGQTFKSDVMLLPLGGCDMVLGQDIGLLVKMFKPKTLYDAYQLARMQEIVRSVNTKRYAPILPTPKHTVNTVRSVNTKRYTPILPTPTHSINTVTTSRNATYNARPTTTQLALPSAPFNKSVTLAQTPQEGFHKKNMRKKELRNYVSTVTK
nr:reverse transcriptase [Tanacetum cinerariifolium]